MMPRKCFLFDLDGTLADGSHREHLIKCAPEDKKWAEYFDLCDLDTPITHNIIVANSLNSAGWAIIIPSGRSDLVKGKTIMWLQKYFPWYEKLYMRAADDFTNDDELKIKMLEQIRKDGYDPIMAFDDRTRVVNAWRAAGIPCAQVAPGDF
jgi:phosphoglycolate phosphatase-like HAD superfamily hydrolase